MAESVEMELKPGNIAADLVHVIDGMLDGWPAGHQLAEMSLKMTAPQWSELADALRLCLCSRSGDDCNVRR